MAPTTLTAQDWREAQAAFLFAHDLLRRPDPEQHAWLCCERTRRTWARLVGALSEGESASGQLPSQLAVPEDAADYERVYLSTFEVGLPHPPVPLIESHYRAGEPVPRVLHENILFHRAFGLSLRDQARETSDHLRHQLELVAHLLELGAGATEQRDAESLAQVERGLDDFGRRHLLSWLDRALECADRTGIPWVSAILEMVGRLIRSVVADPDPPIRKEEARGRDRESRKAFPSPAV